MMLKVSFVGLNLISNQLVSEWFLDHVTCISSMFSASYYFQWTGLCCYVVAVVEISEYYYLPEDRSFLSQDFSSL